MGRGPSLTQLALALGIAVGVALLLILSLYAIHKMLRREREEGPLGPRLRSGEEQPNVAIAMLQGVIADLKARQKELEDRLRGADARAQEGTRWSEIIVSEMPTALMVFDREGFLLRANAAASALLGIDRWSRQRYPELLGAEAPLVASIGEALQGGSGKKWERLQISTARGEWRAMKVFLAPFHTLGGQVAGVVCLLGDAVEGLST